MNLYDFQAIGDTRNAQAVEEFYGDDESIDYLDEAEVEFDCLNGEELAEWATDNETYNDIAHLMLALREFKALLPDPVREAWNNFRYTVEREIADQLEAESK